MTPLAALALLPISAWAQSDGVKAGLVVLGPLTLQPRLAITNVGIDTNVYNTPDRPTRDVTATFVPGIDSRLRVGRTVVTAKTSLEAVYFQKSSSQRSIGYSQEGRFEAFLARITPFVSGGHSNTHERPNVEIDERVEQNRDSVGGGLSVRIGGRTAMTMSLDRRHLEFAGDASPEIAVPLNRATTVTTASVARDLTPLTTFVVRADAQTDRFDYSPLRNSNSAGMLAGFDLKPFALISGTAMVGYRHVNALNQLVPDFGGVVASVKTAYLFRESTLFSVTAGRNVEYSIEATEPYYVILDGHLTVRQSLGGRWDAVGQAGRSTLNYQALLLGPVPAEGRRDRTVTYGCGLGVRVNPVTRAGVDVIYTKRLSPVEEQQYEGFRVGGSLIYAY